MPKIITPGQAQGNRELRTDMVAALYGSGRAVEPGDQPDGAYLLGRIDRTLSRYTGNQQTAFDRGATRTAANATSSQMASQVDRAITQVLGRSAGSSSESFAQALASAFPMGVDGQVATIPQRSAVQILTGMPTSSPDGLNGLLSTRQATLARQTQLIASDAKRVLAAIQPFDPRAEGERIEALRSLCASLVATALAEVTRVDEPRGVRLDPTYTALRRAALELGKAAYLDDPKLVTTADDESRAAGWRLFERYVGMMRAVWADYKDQEAAPRGYSLSEILERVTVEMPGLARSAGSFGDALNSVGFVIDSDGRSRSDLFSSLATPSIVPLGNSGIDMRLAPITPFDLSDWLTTFAGQEAPGYLSSSGVFGLAFVGDQADSLFWTVAPVLLVVNPEGGTVNLMEDQTLTRLLRDERVRWSLDDLVGKLNTIANLVADAE